MTALTREEAWRFRIERCRWRRSGAPPYGSGQGTQHATRCRYRHDVSGVGNFPVPWEGRQAEHDPLWEYLMEHFGPDKPPPPLPERLQAGWQVY